LVEAVSADDGGQTSPVTGESTKETVKTIARGMPGVSGVTVVTNAACLLHTTRGCGRIGRPAFPAPSDYRGQDVQDETRAKEAARSRSVSMHGGLFEI